MIDNQILDHLSGKCLRNAPLYNFTTFRLGGICPCLVTCQTPDELAATVRILSEHQAAYILIGGGSNIVVSDEGLDCIVIRYVSDAPLIRRNGDVLEVSGSTQLDDLVAYAADQGLEGLNYASGIPGTVGGAVVGNAGAFGRQVGDGLISATVMTPQGETKVLGPQDLGFSYRHSHLKETDDVVVSVALAVREDRRDDLQREREEILTLRREKHPDLKMTPCAGSFFRNVEPTSRAGRRQSAGWFLEQAGAKRLRVGGAGIFERHANIIVKHDGCTAEDVYRLSCQMAALVQEHFGLTLVREVRFAGRMDAQEWDQKRVIW